MDDIPTALAQLLDDNSKTPEQIAIIHKVLEMVDTVQQNHEVRIKALESVPPAVCAQCHGTGRNGPGEFSDTCPVCHGLRSVGGPDWQEAKDG